MLYLKTFAHFVGPALAITGPSASRLALALAAVTQRAIVIVTGCLSVYRYDINLVGVMLMSTSANAQLHRESPSGR